MEFISSLLLVLFSSLLLSADARHLAFAPSPFPSPNSPSPSNNPTPGTPCKSLFTPAFRLPAILSPALRNICSITGNPSACASLISPCMSGPVNSISSLEAFFRSLLEHVELALSFALKLSKNNSTSSDTITALKLCIELYIKIIDDLKKTLDEFKAGDFVTVKTSLTAVITDFIRCDEAFHQLGLTKNWPMKKINRTLIQLAELGFDILEKLIVEVH